MFICLFLSTQSLVCFVHFLLSFLAYSMSFEKYTELFSYLDPRHFWREWKHVRKGYNYCKANNSNTSSLQVLSLVKIFTLETLVSGTSSTRRSRFDFNYFSRSLKKIEILESFILPFFARKFC